MDNDREELQGLVDDDDIDGLLALVTLDEIAEAWCRYSATSPAPSTDDPDWWAIDLFLNSAIYQQPKVCRALLLKLLEHANDDVLGSIGAGPLENLVSDDEDNLVWLETECARNPRLRKALSCAWYTGWVSGVTAIRLGYAATIAHLGPRSRKQWPQVLVAYDEAEQHLYDMCGREWWLIDNPTAEQTDALNAYLSAEQRLRETEAFTGPSKHWTAIRPQG